MPDALLLGNGGGRALKVVAGPWSASWPQSHPYGQGGEWPNLYTQADGTYTAKIELLWYSNYWDNDTWYLKGTTNYQGSDTVWNPSIDVNTLGAVHTERLSIVGLSSKIYGITLAVKLRISGNYLYVTGADKIEHQYPKASLGFVLSIQNQNSGTVYDMSPAKLTLLQ